MIMKQRLFIFALMSFVAFSACKPEPADPLPSNVTLTESAIAVGTEGGSYTIGYTIENPNEWSQLRVTTDANWITNLDWTGEGVISFTVQPNSTSNVRTGSVVVSYDFKEYPISVTQEDFKIVYEAPLTVSNFYGEGNYQFQLGASDYINNQQLKANSRYYIFDIYTDPQNYPADPDCYDLPMGTYTIDTLDTYEIGTASSYYSYYLETDESKVTDYSFVSGTITIDEQGVKAEVFTEDGTKHVVTGGKHAHNTSSTIYEDVNIDFTPSATIAGATYWGDYYDYMYSGAKANYELELIDMEKMVAVSLDLISDNNLGISGIPTGTYSVYEPSWSEDFSGNAALPGYFGGTKVYPSFLATLTEEGALTGVSFLAGGEVTIAKNADDTYTVTLNATNDTHDGNKITGSWTGTIEIEDGNDPSNYEVSRQPANRTNRYPAKAKR